MFIIQGLLLPGHLFFLIMFVLYKLCVGSCIYRL